MKFNKWTLGLCAAVAITVAGCSSTPTDPAVIAYDSEKAIADGAAAATHAFNLLYPTNSTPVIASTRQTLYSVDTNLSVSLTVVDALRTNYVATGETNVNLAAALTAALATVSSQYALITNLVNSVK